MKRAIWLLGVSILLGVLAGCGGGSSGTTPNNTGNGGGSGGSSTPPPLAAGTELLYVGDNVGVIHGFAVDPNSGKPTALSPTTQIPIPPVTNDSSVADVGLAADFGGMILYATVAGTGGPNVFSYIVNKTTGALAPAGQVALSVPLRGHLAAIETNLYVIPDPSANSAQLFGFSISGNAGLTPLTPPSVALPGVPHDLTVAGLGNNLPSWLGVTFDGATGGEVQPFLRSPNGGTSGLQPGSPTSTGGTSPQDIRVTPDGKFVVVANTGTNNLSVFSLDSTTGALTAVSGSPFPGGSQPGPVAIDPSPGAFPAAPAKFVFVADSGDNTLSTYTIDSAGSLTHVGTPIPLGGSPQHIAVDPSGKFVFISIVSRAMAGFGVDQSTGALTPIPGSPFAVSTQGPTREIVFVPGSVQ